MGNDGRGIAGHQRFILAEPQNDRAAATSCNELARLMIGDDHDAVGPLDLLQRFAHRVFQIPLVAIGDQLDQHFGIGIRNAFNSLLSEAIADRLVVFDDPVVHHGEMPGGIAVRMSVHLVRGTVCRPAGMPDANIRLFNRLQVRRIYQLAQCANLARVLDHTDLPIVQTGDPG